VASGLTKKGTFVGVNRLNPPTTCSFWGKNQCSLILVVLTAIFLLSFTSVMKAQKPDEFASLEQLDQFGIRIIPKPGIYDTTIRIHFEVPDSMELIFRINDGRGIWKKAPVDLIVDEPVTLQCRVKIPGTQNHITYCGSYIIGCGHTLPVVCLTVHHDDFFPPEGIYVGHHIMDEDSVLIPIGRAFKKEKIPSHVEFFYDRKLVESGPFALKTFGGMTLGYPEKSLRIVGDEQFGKKKLKYRFFDSRPYNEYKSVVFRTSGNDQAVTRFKDIALSSVARDLGVDYMDFQPAVLYINGQYWGIHHLREKTGKTYVNIIHQADKDSLVFIQGSGMRHPDYLKMIRYMTRNYRQPDFVATMDSMLDIDNYFNFMIFQIFNANVDSRGNIRFWKASNLDNRYRWLFYDADHSAGMEFTSRNFLADKLSPTETHWYNPPYSTVIIRSLLANDSLRIRFINQYALLLGSWLRSDSMTRRIEYFKQWLEPEMPRHFKRRNHLRRETMKSWNRKVDDFKAFYQRMPAKAYEQLKQVFHLKGTWVLDIVVEPGCLKALKINESSLRFFHFTGQFFEGVPLAVEATCSNHLYRFTGWKGFAGWENFADTTRRLMLEPKKKDTIGLIAAYMHIPESSLYNEISFARFYKTMQTEKPLQWITWVNRDYYHRSIPPMTLYEDISHAEYAIPRMTLEGYESVVLCNDTNLFMRQFPYYEGVIIGAEFPVQFSHHHHWVLVDSSGCWVDSLVGTIPDRLLEKENRFLASIEHDSIGWKAFDVASDSVCFSRKPEHFIDSRSGRIPLTEEIYIGSAILATSLVVFFIFQTIRN
jgi:hypothetical protein